MRIGTMTSALGVRRETGEKIQPAEVVRRCAAASSAAKAGKRLRRNCATKPKSAAFPSIRAICPTVP